MVDLMQMATGLFCGTAMIIWMSIATMSRSEKTEAVAQRVMFYSCLAAAVSLFGLHYSGGSIWGSEALARPLAVICVVVAISANMNLKGETIQKGGMRALIAKREREAEEE